MTSSPHGLYVQGYTRATMAGTNRREVARRSQSEKTSLSSDWSLQLDSGKFGLQAATRLHEVGFASPRGGANRKKPVSVRIVGCNSPCNGAILSKSPKAVSVRIVLCNSSMESLVIADQHAAVNTFPGLVHTARHITKVGCTRRR